jgi:alcohol dehydrogenase (cytochrome c)
VVRFVFVFLIILSISALFEMWGETLASPLSLDTYNFTGERLGLESGINHENKSGPFVESYKGTEDINRNNWLFLNHDIYGTRNSNQSIINKENVNKLVLKWRLLNDFEFQSPPIVVNNTGYVQDYGGNILAINSSNGKIFWKSKVGNGPTMGLAFDRGLIYASTATNATVVAVDAASGKIRWISDQLGDPNVGYSIDSQPMTWKDYVLVGSGGSGLPPGLGMVKGNITALNRTNGQVIWNFKTTDGEWIQGGKTPPNGGATAWSGGSIDPDNRITYIPLGSASPNFNASTRQSPNLYSNHMVALNITNGTMLWATPFISQGTVLNVTVPDTHDWDTSWGSSVSSVRLQNNTEMKIVVGHDKMGNVIAMDPKSGAEIWWRTLGLQHKTDQNPQPNGSGMIWAGGVYNFHAVDNNTLFISATNRGLNFFTDGISGHKVAAHNTIEQGLYNGSIYALELATGMIKWEYEVKYPPRVSPLVTNKLLFVGYLPFAEKLKSGIIVALDKETGQKLWEYNVNGPIGPVGPSLGNGMLFVPTGKLANALKSGVEASGSIAAFGLP